MVDLVHCFPVWRSPTSPRAKGVRTPPTLDLIVCAGRVGPICCVGIRFVGLVVMA